MRGLRGFGCGGMGGGGTRGGGVGLGGERAIRSLSRGHPWGLSEPPRAFFTCLENPPGPAWSRTPRQIRGGGARQIRNGPKSSRPKTPFQRTTGRLYQYKRMVVFSK